jgi:hypothetical protein
MLHTAILERRLNKSKSLQNQKPRTSQTSEAEANHKKSLQLAKTQVTESIRNAQLNHSLQRRLFF